MSDPFISAMLAVFVAIILAIATQIAVRTPAFCEVISCP